MSEIDNLRALLVEARRLLHQHATVEAWATRDRIDAALSRVELERWNWEQSAKARERERDEARAEIERLRAEVEHWKGAAKEYAEVQDEARAHLAAVEKLLPCEAYIGDKTLAENLADWIRDLRHEAKERGEFAAAETGHANRWSVRAHKAEAEVKRLRGLTPEFPPRPPDGEGLPRYGLRWNGPTKPLAVPLADGYWTPWHLADAAYRRGAEAMREAAAKWVKDFCASGKAQAVRALPIPEDKS